MGVDRGKVSSTHTPSIVFMTEAVW